MLQSFDDDDDNKYITCDEYNGTNTPKRFNYNLIEYWKKDNFTIDIKINITSITIRNNQTLIKSIGTWTNAGAGHKSFISNLHITNPENLQNIIPIYRIYTVVVSYFYIN